ncbi:MarR family winged helix-turn-helix transcriptional regulator [Micromonospora fluostatini]|uniref:MarR family winged helix-turn-helix transcriptional regulator n=1 Tax=Micromonospora sp. JCM 30529 TaxID=3421643 RepID=UPI003D176720
MAAALDDAAGTLLAVWEAARERTTHRLSSAQLRAVVVVDRRDGINLRRLAAELNMLLSSASRLCDRLEAAGMLEREPGRVDRREISLHLTPQARRLLAELQADRRQRLTEVLAGMSAAGRQALLRGITEFDEVGRAQPGPPDAPDATPPADPAPPLDAASTRHGRAEPAVEPQGVPPTGPVEPPDGLRGERRSREAGPDRWRSGSGRDSWPAPQAGGPTVPPQPTRLLPGPAPASRPGPPSGGAVARTA